MESARIIDHHTSERLRKEKFRRSKGSRPQSSRTQTADETAFRESLGITFGRWYRATKSGPDAVLSLVIGSGGSPFVADTFYPVPIKQSSPDTFYPRQDDWKTILQNLKARAQAACYEYYADDPGWHNV